MADKMQSGVGSSDGLGCPATYRKFEYHTMIVGDDAECIALMTQVMQSYPNANLAAVAAWFSQAYGHPNEKLCRPADNEAGAQKGQSK